MIIFLLCAIGMLFLACYLLLAPAIHESRSQAEEGAAKAFFERAHKKKKICFILAIVILIPGIAFSLYFVTGNLSFAEGKERQLEKAISTLSRELERTPEDVAGWMVLADLFLLRKDLNGASAVLYRALEFTRDRPEPILRLAYILTRQNDNHVPVSADPLLERILELEPDNAQALDLSAIAALQRGEYQTAVALWQRLLTVMDKTSDEYQRITRLIRITRDKLRSKTP